MCIHTENTPRPSHEDRARRPLQGCESGPPIIVPAILEGMSRLRRLQLPSSTSRPSRRPWRPTASMAGCSTTSAGSTRLRPPSPHVNDQGGHLATRRWYYLIPATGEPRGLVHAIEKNCLAHLPGTTERYAGRDAARGRPRTAAGGHVAASRWSIRPRCAIPYVSRVDAGTVELVRQSGVEVVSSGDLVQRFSTVWDAPAIATPPRGVGEAPPREGSRVRRDRPPAARRRADDRIRHPAADGRLVPRRRARSATPTRWCRRRTNAGNPHYLPTATVHRAIRRDDLVLLDLWGKLDAPGAVFADITWMGYTGARCPNDSADAFAAIRDARDAGVELVQ